MDAGALKTRRDSSAHRIVTALPTALFVVGCLLMVFEMVMNSARGVGVTTLMMHLVAGCLLLVIIGIPFAYQMHSSGNGKGLLAGVFFWLLIGLLNFGTMATYWPLKLVIAANQDEFLEIHDHLKIDEIKDIKRRIGGIWVEQVMSVNNGNTYFVTSGPLGDSEGLLYSPIGNPVGINQWSNIRVSENWAVVEED